MSTNSKIEWTDKTWNPVTGCDKVSAGCRNCYAERIANRFRGTPAFPNGFDVTLHPGRISDPLKWKTPARVFVNSMSDLFHKDIPFDFQMRVYQTMLSAERHTFQILTKRSDRMLAFLSSRDFERLAKDFRPMGHIQHGVSVENQDAANARIHDLLSIPAWATGPRFISGEPLLGAVDLNHLPIIDRSRPHSPLHYSALHETHDDCFYSAPSRIDWVIVGGESGAGARPMNPAWARALRDQCQAAGVPFFFKQWGAWRPAEFADDWIRECDPVNVHHHVTTEPPLIRVGKKAAGRLLDGREWNEYPKAGK